MRIRVVPLIGPRRLLNIEVDPDVLVYHLKEAICSKLGVPPDNMRISFRGRVLNELKSLREHGLHEASEEEVVEEGYFLFPQGEGG